MTLERLIRVAQTALEGSEADLGHVTAQTRLQEDLGLNSITMLMLMIGIEDEFSIRFPTERLPELHTVGDVVAVIEELLHAPALTAGRPAGTLGLRRADARCAGACAAQRVLPPRHLHRKRRDRPF